MRTTEAYRPASPPIHHGHALRAAVMQRREELELRLAELQNSEQQGTAVPLAIEGALAMLDAILPAEDADVPPVIAEQLARWLEANRYVGVVERKPRRRSSHR